jgi:glycosyltransferase involved in cell wall biosynthesis
VTRPKLLFLVTEDWYFCSHRLPIALAAQKKGFDVVVATRVNRHAQEILREGFKLIPLKLERRSTNPIQELASFLEIARIYHTEKPDIVHHVAMKPLLYGSLAALFTGVPHVVNALAGMGFIFISTQLKARLLKPVIRVAFKLLLNRNNCRLILQNKDDCDMFLDSGIVSNNTIRLIRGSGVDSNKFRFVPEADGPVVVVLASRMLWDKGVGEFVAAARLLRERGAPARFLLVGDTDIHNPAAISREQLLEWNTQGIIEWVGRCDDMPSVFETSHIVCLPSYREGLPKVLLEAASCGRPIVTTDSNGCRDVVQHGENGYLVPVGSTVELADALHALVLNSDLRKRMGARGREIIIQHFMVDKIINETMMLYEELLQQ